MTTSSSENDLLARVLQAVADDERDQRTAAFSSVAQQAGASESDTAVAVARLREMHFLQIMYDVEDPQCEEGSHDSLRATPSLQHLRHSVLGLERSSQETALQWLEEHLHPQLMVDADGAGPQE